MAAEQASLRTRLGLHAGVILAVVLCLTAPIAVQGVVLRYAVSASRDAKDTAEIARAVTDPNCDPRVPACQRANEARARQGATIPDLNEVSVIASFCGNQHGTLSEVCACVEREFTARTSYPPAGGGTRPRPTTTEVP